MREPIRLRNYIVVDKGNDFGTTLTQGAISCTAEARYRLNGVAGFAFQRNSAGCIVSLRVINDKNFSGRRIEQTDRR